MGAGTSPLKGALIARPLQISFQMNINIWKQATLSSAKHKSLGKSDVIKMDMWPGLGKTLQFQSILTRLILCSNIFILCYYFKHKYFEQIILLLAHFEATKHKGLPEKF